MKKNNIKFSLITFAYNVEKYIDKCAESVISQTFSDFEWIVVDNGSVDRTGEILAEYADKDSRIKVYKNNQNSYMEGADFKYKNFSDVIEMVKGEYFATLDSDDELYTTFFEEMYKEIEIEQPDMVVCGNDFIDEEKKEKVGERVPLRYSGKIEGMFDFFVEQYGCMRPMWGKIYKSEIWKKYENTLKLGCENIVNGGDTIFNLRFLKLVKTISFLDKSLYKYLIRKSSVYHSNTNVNRYKGYDVIFSEGLSLLVHYNCAIRKNISFLSQVHINSMLDLMNIVRRYDGKDYNEIIRYVINVLNSIGLTIGIYFMNKQLVSQMFIYAFDVSLKNTRAAIVNNVFDNEVGKELMKMMSNINGISNIESAILLGQTLSAYYDKQKEYIEYSKMWIEYLIKHNRLDEAKKELKEWEKILPNDENLQKYQLVL